MAGIPAISPLVFPRLCTKPRHIVKMSATVTRSNGVAVDSMVIKAPSHPTYDMKGIVKLALAEDASERGDVTCMATIPADMDVEAHFLAKEDGIIAGIALAEIIFSEVDPSLKVEWSQKDGDHVRKGLQFGKVYGRAPNIIVAERVVLNFMQRMSGIATLTKEMVDAAYPATILETRKTAPGLRLVDKWAVLIGGGRNHRMGLFDMVMIKDNHISIAGGVTAALKCTDQYLSQKNLQMEVEIETRTLEEVDEVLTYASQTKTSLTRITLDNMVVLQPSGDIDVSMLKKAVELINGRFETEASGNVTLETVHKIGQTGVTYISSLHLKLEGEPIGHDNILSYCFSNTQTTKEEYQRLDIKVWFSPGFHLPVLVNGVSFRPTQESKPRKLLFPRFTQCLQNR